MKRLRLQSADILSWNGSSSPFHMIRFIGLRRPGGLIKNVYESTVPEYKVRIR